MRNSSHTPRLKPVAVHELWKLALTCGFVYLESQLRDTENRWYLRRELAGPSGVKKMLDEGIPVAVISAIVSKNIGDSGYNYPKTQIDPDCDCGKHFIGVDNSDESD
jgi:hypothetical protein